MTKITRFPSALISGNCTTSSLVLDGGRSEMILLRQSVKTGIHRVVEETYTSPISLDKLACLSGRSLSNFKREFQNIYGESPARWIREWRLSKAYEMQRLSRLSVVDAACSLGFKNPAHFSRIFKNVTGKTPSEFLDEQRRK